MAKMINLDMTRDVMPGIKMTVEVNATGFRALKVRFWIAAQLLKLAGRVLNCSIEIRDGGVAREEPNGQVPKQRMPTEPPKSNSQSDS